MEEMLPPPRMDSTIKVFRSFKANLRRTHASFPPFIVDNLQMGMSDDTERQSRLVRMDEAFRAAMHAAIEAGQEQAPVGVVTTPGTQSPKYVPAEPRPLASPSGKTNF